MITCGKCKQTKPDEEFAWKIKSKGRRNSYCRSCQKEYRQRHYKDNHSQYRERISQWKKDQKTQFYDWLSLQSCKDCGNCDTRVLECDHLSDKEFGISSKIGTYSFERLMIEISKCDIVCANCHRIRTIERGNHFKGSFLSDATVV